MHIASYNSDPAPESNFFFVALVARRHTDDSGLDTLYSHLRQRCYSQLGWQQICGAPAVQRNGGDWLAVDDLACSVAGVVGFSPSS